MKNLSDPSLARYRIVHPALGFGDDNGGFFSVGGLAVMAGNGDGWDHVSVSRINRCPTWDEMNLIKDMFFYPEECVIQYHPKKSDYINKNPNVLHLWRQHGVEVPMPPKWMV